MAVDGGGLIGSPPVANQKLYGKGNWKISAGTSADLEYSTDGLEWYNLCTENSPQILYSCELFINTASTGFVDRVPDVVIPRYTRETEAKSVMKDDKDSEEIEIVQPAEYYEDGA